MRTHGHRRKRRSSPTYVSWLMMNQRCSNRRHKSYEDYGGRGILVYFGWVGRGGFEEFLADVGKRPSRRHTLDRIDPDGNYEPGNVRWATKSVQNSNKSGFIYELDGERFTLYEKAAELKIHPGALRKRISRLLLKYSLEEARRIAFTTPKGKRR
jgi:hypothetical protein